MGLAAVTFLFGASVCFPNSLLPAAFVVNIFVTNIWRRAHFMSAFLDRSFIQL